VILSNGNLHYFWDLERGNPYLITSFPSPDSVMGYKLVTPDPQQLAEAPINADYIVLTQRPNYQAAAAWKNEVERPGYIQAHKLRFLRPYQLKAIDSLQKAVKEGKDRFLFEMATGTGKTLTAAAVEAGQWDRVIDYVNREVFNKPKEYYSLDKLRKAAAVDRRLTLREILEKIFGLIPSFKSKDELLEEEFAKFVADTKPEEAEAIPAIKTYFKAYITSDQMVQAARSGRQNIAEGSRAAATSSQTELRLVNVARSSLEELLLDYEDFLRHRHLPRWKPDSPEAMAVRNIGRHRPDPSDPSDQTDPSDEQRYAVYAAWLDHENPAIRANALICLIHQANTLLDRQIEALEAQFIEGGGYSEQLATARLAERSRKKDEHQEPIPPCTLCGKPMVLRTAQKGKSAGKQFWGCSGYPDCKGLINV